MKIVISLCFIQLLTTSIFGQWEVRNNGVTDDGVMSLFISNNEIFAGTFNGVFVSNNNGLEWIPKNAGINYHQISSIFKIGEIIYIGCDGHGVFASSDDGNTWIGMNNGLGVNTRVTSLENYGNLLVAGTLWDGIFVSTDAGNNWSKDSSDICWPVWDFAFLGNDIIAGTHGGVYLSTDNGQRWIKKNIDSVTTIIWSLAIYENNILAGTGGVIFHISSDRGDHWVKRRIDSVFSEINVFLVDGSNIYAGTRGKGIYFSSDKGNNWKQINNGLNNLAVYSLAIKGDNIFAGTLGGGVFHAKLSDLITDVDENNWSNKTVSLFHNPFSESTTINYELTTAGRVKIDIFNSVGEKITTLVDEWQVAGRHNCEFGVGTHCNVSLQSGMYFYRMQMGDRVEGGKMVIVE